MFTWNEHIQSINLKISKGNGILCSIRDCPQRILRTLCYAFIQPYVDYGLLTWGCAPKTYLEPIRRNLRKAIRIISFKDNYECTKELFLDSKILEFDKNYMYKIGIFMYKLDNKLLTNNICSMFQRLNNEEENITSGFLLPSVKTNFGKRFIYFKGIIYLERCSKNLKK